eukprot:2527043-Rhodomonas_salina.1
MCQEQRGAGGEGRGEARSGAERRGDGEDSEERRRAERRGAVGSRRARIKEKRGEERSTGKEVTLGLTSWDSGGGLRTGLFTAAWTQRMRANQRPLTDSAAASSPLCSFLTILPPSVQRKLVTPRVRRD